MSNNGPGVTNPMLYDPPEGQASNTKLMQFVAGVGGELNLRCLNFINQTSSFFSVSFAAISAGTALGWTSPVLSQLTPVVENGTTSSNSTDGFTITAEEGMRLSISRHRKASDRSLDLAVELFQKAHDTAYRIVCNFITERISESLRQISDAMTAWGAYLAIVL